MSLKCSFVTQTNVLGTIINTIPTQDLRRNYLKIENLMLFERLFGVTFPFFISLFFLYCLGVDLLLIQTHDPELGLGHMPSQNQGIFKADFSY